MTVASHLTVWLLATVLPFSVLGLSLAGAGLYYDAVRTQAAYRICVALALALVIVAIVLWVVLPDGCQYLTPGSFWWYAAGCWLN